MQDSGLVSTVPFGDIHMIDMSRVRTASVRRAKALKYPINAALPHRAIGRMRMRSQQEIIHRTVALQMVFALRFGFDRDRGLAWLRCNGHREWFTGGETEFLDNDIGRIPKESIQRIEAQVECQWALAWVLGFIRKLSFKSYCGDNLVHMFPNFKIDESMEAFLARSKPKRRSIEEVIEMEDLAYCLHWGIVESRIQLKRAPGKVDPYVIIERRRALSWVLGDGPWDDMPMDT